jgi:response regulator RpfG family c-di-GMP phosphodiesterase
MFEIFRANQLNVMLFLCGACAVMAILLFYTRFLPKDRRKILILMELIAFFLLWFDRLAYVYAGTPGFKGYVMVRISNFFVFFLTSMIVLGFNLYLTDWLMHEGGLPAVPLRLIIVQYAAMTGMLLAIISAFTGLYYYFDETNLYHRGHGFLIAYVIPVFAPIIQYTVIHKNKKCFSRLIYTSLVLYIFVPIVCGIIQVFIYGISLVNMAMVLVSIFLYIFTYLDINDTVEHAHKIELEGLHEEQESMKRLFDQTATAFVTAIEKKDDFTEGHSLRVAEYAKRIAELSGKSDDECTQVYYAALLHDVGLIGIPDSVIKNEADPDKWDYETIRKKPVIAREILSSITEYPYLSLGAYYSHERYDGTGYPEGLKACEIPEIARIVAVADAYDTMTTKKRYREARSNLVAREMFVKGAGIEFDPKFAENMVKIIDMDDTEKEFEVENEIICNEYREQITSGIPVEREVVRISFDCAFNSNSIVDFTVPSIILFDSFDRCVHKDEKTINEYKYLEFGEIWFDDHSISTAAREIKEMIAMPLNDDRDACYEIIAGRYEDHVKLIMRSPHYGKEVIVALPGGSKSAYIGITGEHCLITNIHYEQTGDRYGDGDIERIVGKISYIDRMESDVPNIQIDRKRSASTMGIEIKDRLHIAFHTMSLPDAHLVWHCPYIVLFYSDDMSVNGDNYREYTLLKLNGENEVNDELATNKFSMRKKEDFPGWDAWKDANKAGMECEVSVERKGKHIIITTENMGIRIENITVLKDDIDKIYVALTGDQCALTDIRVK